MTDKLKLGPLPRWEVVRLTIVLSALVKADLDHYAKLYGAAYGETVDAAALVPHMLAAFMERDRGFRKARQAGDATPGSMSSSASIRAATSSTSEAAGESYSQQRAATPAQ